RGTYPHLLHSIAPPSVHSWHTVVRVAHHLKALLGHQMIERVEIDVAEQRTAHRALRCAPFGGPLLKPAAHLLFKKRFDQPQNATAPPPPPDRGGKPFFGDRIKIALQIGAHDVDVAGFEQPTHRPAAARPPLSRGQALASPFGAKAVAVWSKVL